LSGDSVDRGRGNCGGGSCLRVLPASHWFWSCRGWGL